MDAFVAVAQKPIILDTDSCQETVIAMFAVRKYIVLEHNWVLWILGKKYLWENEKVRKE